MKIFNALNEHYEGLLTAEGIPFPNDLQQLVLQRTKQGGDLLLTAPEGSGKTTAALMSILQKCPESMEGSPRVIYICNDNDQVRAITKLLRQISRRKELMIEEANDKGNIIEQRIQIFEGADIIIGNPQRIYDLYIQNGINLGELKLMIMDDTENMMGERLILGFRRLITGLPKCQRFIMAGSKTEKLQRFSEEFLQHPAEAEFNGQV